MPPYGDICEDCGRPRDGLVDGLCKECREEGEYILFSGESGTGLYDALLLWSFVHGKRPSELMPDL
ncbi:MAG: hypothetical protein WD940_02240 [Patescibacteria group bacterium]